MVIISECNDQSETESREGVDFDPYLATGSTVCIPDNFLISFGEG